jgi:hypothetical protein
VLSRCVLRDIASSLALTFIYCRYQYIAAKVLTSNMLKCTELQIAFLQVRGKVVPVLKLIKYNVRKTWRYSSTVLDLGTRWRYGQLHDPVALPDGEMSLIPIR